jgi:hypothetical protein
VQAPPATQADLLIVVWLLLPGGGRGELEVDCESVAEASVVSDGAALLGCDWLRGDLECADALFLAELLLLVFRVEAAGGAVWVVWVVSVRGLERRVPSWEGRPVPECRCGGVDCNRGLAGEAGWGLGYSGSCQGAGLRSARG